MADDTEPKTSSCVLRLRGLPFQATEDDIKEFFTGFELVEAHICRRNGRATGEAYVQLGSEEIADEALKTLNKKNMGRRYIEIFEAFDSDLAAVKSMKDNHQVRGFVLRLRGLPYSASAADVEKFFEGVPLHKGQEGVVFTFTPEGRRTGEAYVEFDSEELQREALKRHRESMGTRYIEIFVSSKPDMYQAMSQSRYVASDIRRRWVASPLAAVPEASGRARGTPYHGIDQVTDLFRGFGLGPRGVSGLRPDMVNNQGPGRPDGMPHNPLSAAVLQPVGSRKPMNNEYHTIDATGALPPSFNGQQMLLPQDYNVQQQQQQQLIMQQQYLMQLQGQAMRYEPWGSMGVFGGVGMPHQGSALGANNWYKQYGAPAGASVPGGLGLATPYHVQPMPGFGMTPMMPPEHSPNLGISDVRVVQHAEPALSSNKESAADCASLEQGTPTHRSF